MSATWTLTKLDVLRVIRNTRYLIFAIAMPSVLYLAIGNSNKLTGDVEFKAYYMLAMATYGSFAGALMNNSIRISTERKTGWTRQLRLTPLPGGGYVFSKVVTSLVTTIPSVLVVFALGAGLFGVQMDAWKWVANAVVLWLSSMVFVSLAVAIGYRFDPETAQPAVMLVFFPMAILGGLWFPLSGTLDKIGQFFPTYQAHKLGTDIISGGTVSMGSIAIVLGWGAVFAALAVVSYRSAREQ
ncbi:ABC transporter permease [Catenulispora yoronensis]|uniref:ABC transporter permease n=1 Tax=Catenulispora yoronensis TaxID=450799 RepID=A0ABP5H4C0_9ACTN